MLIITHLGSMAPARTEEIVKPYVIEVQCVEDCEEVGTEIHRYDYTSKVWVN